MRKEIYNVRTDARRSWNAAKMRKEIVNVLTDDIQKEMERGKDAQRNYLFSNRRHSERDGMRQRCAQKLLMF
jgi:hypothetical protein